MILGLRNPSLTATKTTTLNAKAASWHPKTNSQITEADNSDKKSYREPKPFQKTKQNKENSVHNGIKSKILKFTSENAVDEQSSTSLLLPAFCSKPQPDGNHTLFAGNDDKVTEEHALSFLDRVSLPKIYAQVKQKNRQLLDHEEKGLAGQWMFYDSGASRTVIQADSPLRPLLTQVQPTSGSCTVGSGVKLPYVESGVLLKHNPVTVVDGLHFDLYSAVASAKRGISAVIDFDLKTGANRSFTYCKQTGEAFPLVERKQGVLELPMHLALNRDDTTGLIISDGHPLCPNQPYSDIHSVSRPSPAPRTLIQNQPKPLRTNVFKLGFLRPYHIAAF